MTVTALAPDVATPSGCGALVRAWRRQRRLSQLELACLADVSTRHLSCVETGRAQPSRAFLLPLSEHLDVPLRGRNDLLVAAGYRPLYAESDLLAEHMAPVRLALDLVLGQHEPFPALVVDRTWHLVRANVGAAVLLEDVDPALLAGRPNVLRLALHPGGLGPRLLDLATFSGHVLGRLRRQVALTGDPELAALHDELAGYPGVVAVEPWTEHPGVLLPLQLVSAYGVLSFLTTAATFGTAADVTAAELTVESFFRRTPSRPLSCGTGRVSPPASCRPAAAAAGAAGACWRAAAG